MALDRLMIVIDPTRADQPAFRRGLAAARVMGAGLHLYTCVAGQEVGDGAVQGQRSLLQALAREASDAGVAASIEVDRDPDWRAQVVRAAARNDVDLVIKHSFDHSELQRELRATSDWILLRNAPCPVLMIKGYRDWNHRRILGAIDVNSRDGAHSRLNNRIVSVTRRFAAATGSEAHFVNSFEGRRQPPLAMELGRRCGVPPERVHIAQGPAHEVVADAAESLDVDLIVIGTVGRSGIAGKWLGNTAERLLDHTHIDVLVVN